MQSCPMIDTSQAELERIRKFCFKIVYLLEMSYVNKHNGFAKCWILKFRPLPVYDSFVHLFCVNHMSGRQQKNKVTPF